MAMKNMGSCEQALDPSLLDRSCDFGSSSVPEATKRRRKDDGCRIVDVDADV